MHTIPVKLKPGTFIAAQHAATKLVGTVNRDWWNESPPRSLLFCSLALDATLVGEIRVDSPPTWIEAAGIEVYATADWSQLAALIESPLAGIAESVP